ncbi:unnamed protein product [Adineta steineri]|uniref:Uncharacterized protein n=1 Tax=Adineta steineri TaxID=433720 RepID=A0A819Y4B6_9BILA|nr:unnamed protein product [Adineta steineri]
MAETTNSSFKKVKAIVLVRDSMEKTMKVAHTSTSEEIICTIHNIFNLLAGDSVTLVEEDTGDYLCSPSPIFFWDNSNDKPRYRINIYRETSTVKEPSTLDILLQQYAVVDDKGPTTASVEKLNQVLATQDNETYLKTEPQIMNEITTRMGVCTVSDTSPSKQRPLSEIEEYNGESWWCSEYVSSTGMFTNAFIDGDILLNDLQTEWDDVEKLKD